MPARLTLVSHRTKVHRAAYRNTLASTGVTNKALTSGWSALSSGVARARIRTFGPPWLESRDVICRYQRESLNHQPCSDNSSNLRDSAQDVLQGVPVVSEAHPKTMPLCALRLLNGHLEL